MADERAELLECVGLEEMRQPLARGQQALLVPFLDLLLTAPGEHVFLLFPERLETLRIERHGRPLPSCDQPI